MSAMHVTDVHAHLLLGELHAEVERRAPELLAKAVALEWKRNGPESQAVSNSMVGARVPKLTRVAERLAAMNAQGIDRQWVSASPNHFYPWAPEGLAAWVAGEANRLIAEHVAQDPDRLVGLGLVPLQHPDRIVEYLDDAVLGRGLAGVEISSFGGPVAAVPNDQAEEPRTVELSDARLEPFWARAAELGAVVFLHPFGCTLEERLDRFYLANTVGQPVENAVALSHFIFAGVLDRHPSLKVVAAHGGGYLPTAIGRSDHAWRVRSDAQHCEYPPSTYLRRIWFDTVVHDHVALRHLIAVAGHDRVVLGSDFPFDMGVEDPVSFVREVWATSEPDSEDATRRILGGNAEDLLAGKVSA